METPAPAEPATVAEEVEAQPEARIPAAETVRRGIRWGSVLLSALGGLLALLAGQWLTEFVQSLLQRQDWLGWAMLALLALAGFAAAIIALSEIWSLLRLRRLGRLRESAQSAVNHDDAAAAKQAADGVKRLYASRADLAWARARLAEHDGDIVSARERLVLVERELIASLDDRAASIIAATARRVSVLTAVSPSSIVDMAAVGLLNLGMLRRLAGCYGARPGGLGLLKACPHGRHAYRGHRRDRNRR